MEDVMWYLYPAIRSYRLWVRETGYPVPRAWEMYPHYSLCTLQGQGFLFNNPVPEFVGRYLYHTITSYRRWHMLWVRETGTSSGSLPVPRAWEMYPHYSLCTLQGQGLFFI